MAAASTWKGASTTGLRSRQQEGDDSDGDEPRLAIVDQEDEEDMDMDKDGGGGGGQQVVPVGRVLHKSMSMDTSRSRDSGPTWSLDEDKKSASEAIESLLLLGQRPVLSPKFEVR